MNIFDATNDVFLKLKKQEKPGFKVNYDLSKTDNNVIVVEIGERSFKLTVG
jgi:hypothetical protein